MHINRKRLLDCLPWLVDNYAVIAGSTNTASETEERMRAVAEHGYRVNNVDLTVLAEAPKLAPHNTAIRARIAQLLEVDESRVGLKATTTEGLGLVGRREGIAAQAVVLLCQ